MDNGTVVAPGTLYVVATPIGNLGDMTPRAVEVMQGVDIIAAEDTRTTMVLTGRFDIHTRLIAHHKFNEEQGADGLIALLQEGKSVALVTDAGTPCISDPGSVLVRRAAEAGIPVIGVSGACAAVTALSVSGFDSASYAFYGFFPREKRAVEEAVAALMTGVIPVSVFYESPLRIVRTMEHLARLAPDVRVCLCNDLTKRYERIYRGRPEEILAELQANPSAQKGEYTLVIDRASARRQDAPEDSGDRSGSGLSGLSLEALLIERMIKEGGTIKEAVTALAQARGDLKKREIYAASLRLKDLLAITDEGAL